MDKSVEDSIYFQLPKDSISENMKEAFDSTNDENQEEIFYGVDQEIPPMKLVNEDEDFLYYEGEFEIQGRKYKVRRTKCKIDPVTNLPMHLSKNRVRWSCPN